MINSCYDQIPTHPFLYLEDSNFIAFFPPKVATGENCNGLFSPCLKIRNATYFSEPRHSFITIVFFFDFCHFFLSLAKSNFMLTYLLRHMMIWFRKSKYGSGGSGWYSRSSRRFPVERTFLAESWLDWLQPSCFAFRGRWLQPLNMNALAMAVLAIFGEEGQKLANFSVE